VNSCDSEVLSKQGDARQTRFPLFLLNIWGVVFLGNDASQNGVYFWSAEGAGRKKPRKP